MANTIQHKRSTTASAEPATSDLSAGEIAVNTADGRLFIEKDGPSIVSFGSGTMVLGEDLTTGVSLPATVFALDNVARSVADVAVFLNGVRLISKSSASGLASHECAVTVDSGDLDAITTGESITSDDSLIADYVRP